MKLYIYIDESGSIHKNSKTRYFAVGGYFVENRDRLKVTSKYKEINKSIKQNRNIDFKTEIKSYDMEEKEKIEIFNEIQDIDSFVGCVKVFDKQEMRKDITDSNIFFNFAVKILFQDCIMPIIGDSEENIEFILCVDNRNIGVGELKSLENYLKVEYIFKNYDFKVTYYDSATNFGVQLADLVVNTFYNKFKDISIVKNVVEKLKNKNFIVSIFPRNSRIK